MTDYTADVQKYTKKVDEEAVAGIVRHCGIALRSKDASMVSCSQKSELETVREKFLKKKLARTEDDATLNKAIDEVCETLGRSNPNKSRVTFYYLLAEKYGQLDLFIKKKSS